MLSDRVILILLIPNDLLISVFVYSCFRPTRIERRMCAQVMSGIIAAAIDTNVTAGKGIVLKRFAI